MKLIYFQLEVLVVSFIIYFASLPQLLSLQIDPIMVVFRFFDFITYSFPAPFPIFFNLAYSFCLVRLSKQNVIGTQAEKTVESSRMKTICFDKTGTLTLNKMEISNVFSFLSGETREVTSEMEDNELISILFASCNSVELINAEVKGDEIDLRMFDFTRSQLAQGKAAHVVREVHVQGKVVEVLKINQYESQFQSMSVLVREPQSGKFYVFVKGSPEMIHHYSLRKVNGFEKLIKRLSFSGFRSIGFGYKEIQESELQQYMLRSREDFLRDTAIVGVVTFVNQLKADAKATISTLAECDINTKIITGDNIFLGVQTALMIGMIPPNSKITVLEGRKYNKAHNSIEALNLLKGENGEIEEQTEQLDNFRYQ
jgi:cation-transporting ATPase 13A3/4/5